MKVFIISTGKNLKIFNEKLGSEFPNLGITGSSSIMHGIETASSRNIEEEYDAIIIINKRFEEEDIISGKKISKKINESAKFALKGVPIYIFVNVDDKELNNYLRSNLIGDNLMIYPYRALTVETVKDAIRESAAMFKSVKTNKEEIKQLVKETLDGVNNKTSNNSAVRDFFNETLEATRTLEVSSILEDVLNSNEISKQSYTVKSVNDIVDSIKNQVYKLEPVTTLVDTPKISVLSNTVLDSILGDENINELVSETDTKFNELKEQSLMVDIAIERVKESDRPNKVEDILNLYGFKKGINKEIGSRRAVVTLDIVSKLQEIIINNSSRNLESIYNLMDEIKAGNMVFENMEQTEALKKIKSEIKTKIESDLINQSLTKKRISELFTRTKEELVNTAKVDVALIEFANSANTIIPDELTKVDVSQIKVISESMENVISLFDKYDGEHLKLLKSFDTLETVNEGIIESQEKTIDILMTQKVSKVFKVDNELKSKALFIFGLPTVGKSFVSYNLAKASANVCKTILIDLTESGSLNYYLKNNKNAKVISDLDLLNELTQLKHLYQVTESNSNLTIITGQFLNQYDSNCVEQNLIQLSSIFESMVIVLPQNLDSYKGILEHCTKKVVLSEPEPQLMVEYKNYLDYLEGYTKSSLSEHFIINKLSKRIPVSVSVICSDSGVINSKYKVHELPRFENALVSKFLGISLYDNNELTKSTFDNLYKKLK